MTWRLSICKDGQTEFLGLFSSAEQCVAFIGTGSIIHGAGLYGLPASCGRFFRLNETQMGELASRHHCPVLHNGMRSLLVLEEVFENTIIETVIEE
jgi:hypothetical protein